MDLARRVYSRELKMAAMREIDSGRTMSEVARQLELSPRLLERWRGEWRARGELAFPGTGRRSPSPGFSQLQRIAELERKIGQLTKENDLFKKSLGAFQGSSPASRRQWRGCLFEEIREAIQKGQGPAVSALCEMLGVSRARYPVPPSMLANYRRGFYPSGAKSDPGDTELLLEIVDQHRDRLRMLQPDTVETRSLQFLGQERRDLVNEKTRAVQQLGDWLKQVFPQVVSWFNDLSSPLVGALLERWPRLEQLQKVEPDTLRQFFQKHNCRSQELIEERITALAAAVPATHDPALLETSEFMIQHLVRLIAEPRETIRKMGKAN